MKHTKGNWYAKEGQIYPEETGKTLALIPYYDKDNEEQEANAKLIAAAPDMLEALNDLINAYEVKMGKSAVRLRIEIAKDAINKATE